MAEKNGDWQKSLFNCNCCPRECFADRRMDDEGYCRAGTDFTVSYGLYRKFDMRSHGGRTGSIGKARDL